MQPEFAPSQSRAVRFWLFAVAGLTFLMVVVGGATRVTESGLSIVEWKPITGVVPPYTAAEWRSEFEKYQEIPQYRLMNHAMSLDEFKKIYWWEWAHRLLGRFIGVAFLLPLLWFWSKGWISRPLGPRLLLIFGLGALQAAVGWWMVASGLVERIEVSQYRLATHLLLACLIFIAALWTALELEARPAPNVSAHNRMTAAALLVLTLLQIYLGALLAGLRGGLMYNTWPFIDGTLFPPITELLRIDPAWRNMFENVLTVQFAHRVTAYALWIGALWHAVTLARRAGSRAAMAAVALAAGATVQVSLGVLTLVLEVPPLLALLHQAMAIVVLGLAVVNAQRLRGNDRGRSSAAFSHLPRRAERERALKQSASLEPRKLRTAPRRGCRQIYCPRQGERDRHAAAREADRARAREFERTPDDAKNLALLRGPSMPARDRR